MDKVKALEALKRLDRFSVKYGEFEGGANQKHYDIETIKAVLSNTGETQPSHGNSRALDEVVDALNQAIDEQGDVRLKWIHWARNKLRSYTALQSTGGHKGDALHEYSPDPEHPQFCGVCGYAKHERLKHTPSADDEKQGG